MEHDRHSRGKHQKYACPIERMCSLWRLTNAPAGREQGRLAEPLMDHRTEDELNAALDDGDDPIAKAEDGANSDVGSADSVLPPQVLFGQVRPFLPISSRRRR